MGCCVSTTVVSGKSARLRVPREPRSKILIRMSELVQMQNNRNFIDDLRKLRAVGSSVVSYFRLPAQLSLKNGPTGEPTVSSLVAAVPAGVVESKPCSNGNCVQVGDSSSGLSRP